MKLEQILPLDLVIEILLKLPTKSIARFRCVSKLWDSTFGSPNFTESFFTISRSRPKLLITCQLDGKTFFFSSSPQSQSRCPTITANFHMSFPMNCPADSCRPVRGLVYGNTQWAFRSTDGSVQLICNPSTGQFLTLPKVNKTEYVVKSWLGYDPVDKQLKVLCISRFRGTPYTVKHQVLTLETGKKLSWRMIKCDIRHFAAGVDRPDCSNRSDGICISGVLYYLAWVVDCYDGLFPDIVCFDVKSETFSYIKEDQGMKEKIESALVNYKGQLAMLQPLFSNKVLYTGIKLWVLQDAEKHQWSRHTYLLPSPWLSEYAWTKLSFAGVTNTGEIVFSPNYITDSFFLVYYNPERNTITRVEIQGMEAYRTGKAHVFFDHVEDVKLMASI